MSRDTLEAIAGALCIAFIASLGLYGCSDLEEQDGSDFTNSKAATIAQWHTPKQGYVGTADAYGNE